MWKTEIKHSAVTNNLYSNGRNSKETDWNDRQIRRVREQAAYENGKPARIRISILLWNVTSSQGPIQTQDFS